MTFPSALSTVPPQTHPAPHWLLLASANDPRTHAFATALQQQQPNSHLTIHDWQQAKLPLATLSEAGLGQLHIRVESASHDLETVRQLSRLGTARAQQQGFAPVPETTLAALQDGAYLPAACYYHGVGERLQQWQQQLQDHGIEHQWMNRPEHIQAVSDKLRCHQQMADAGIAVAEARYDIHTAEQLWQLLQQPGWQRVFVKPRFGAAAAGILALAQLRPDLWRGQTTLHQHQGQWVNSLRPQLLREQADINAVVEQLLLSGIVVEKWLPKLKYRQLESDCRLLVIGGEIRLGVLRCSHSPITNLHLLNQRHPLESLWPLVPAAAISALHEDMAKLAQLFPHSTQLAVDVAFHQYQRRHRVLEVNAFGDFLQRVEYQGMNSYQLQLQHYLQLQLPSQPQMQPHQPL
ncbi:STM4014 family protein [Oceanobacter mangrovi]|uniref:STM4014 family protein n=1 Tax=Oceanobacter mangrovi TaxID=2862510 RepID=UPI001C8D4E1C|nr:STM4014 family protein [Oceanobacter mangrovi]